VALSASGHFSAALGRIPHLHAHESIYRRLYLLVTFGALVVVSAWGWRAAHRGGFEVFSLQTLEAIWPPLLLLVVALAVAWFHTRAKDGLR
jgi:hypothetical protein